MTMVVLTILLVGSTTAKPKYALIETEDAPNKPIGLDDGLDEPGNKIEPAKGADYCWVYPCPGDPPLPWG